MYEVDFTSQRPAFMDADERKEEVLASLLTSCIGEPNAKQPEKGSQKEMHTSGALIDTRVHM